ncbi:MAG: recombinase family protein [Chloroflexia bacterium]|nr:recombinase family protein [Chloroflexia bacterium]
MKNKILVCLYSRVSTKDQDYQSQFDDLRKYSDYKGYEIVGVFGEKVSGYNESAERKEYEALKKFVQETPVKHVLMWELSRLSRRTHQALKEIEFFSNLGINIHFKKEGLDTYSGNATNKMILTILSSVAELERSTIVERSVRGRISSAEQGKRVGFPIMPYGFKDVGGYIAINEEESLIVKKMYQQAASGEPIRRIASNLNSLNVPTRSTTRGRRRKLNNGQEVTFLWKNNTVRKILKSPLYKGERPYRDFVVEVPRIIEVELWDKVQDIFKNRVGYINSTKYEYLLKGKIVCGGCGLTYGARTDQRYDYKPSFYHCHGRKDKAIRCENGQFATGVLDDNVWSNIMLHGPSLLGHLSEGEEKEEDKVGQIEFYRREIETLNAKKKSSAKLFVDNYIDEESLKQVHDQIRNDIIIAENSIRKLQNEIELFKEPDISKKFRDLAANTDFSVRRDLIQQYVDHIKIWNVSVCNIDFTKHSVYETIPGTVKVKQKRLGVPHNNEKIIYVEIYTLLRDSPVKCVMSNVSRINLVHKGLTFRDGELSL